MIDLDMMTYSRPLPWVQELARRAEAAGLGGLWFTESGRTAYLSCTAAALATDHIGIGTAVAVAFPRSPMITAKIAWELAEASNGRFTLGLGTQIKAHIERRYSSDYQPPGPRMREYVESLRAIFAAFRGAPLAYEGEYYSFSLLTPQWSPGNIAVADPPDLRGRGAAVDVRDGRRAVRRRPHPSVPLGRVPPRRAGAQRGPTARRSPGGPWPTSPWRSR